MSYAAFEKFVTPEVSSAQREVLKKFYENHIPRKITAGGNEWNYYLGGEGEEVVLILVGGARYGDSAFHLMLALEDSFRVIAPSYPAVNNMDGLIEGITAILDAEGISRAHVIGTAFGGTVSQFFLMAHPERVAKLVLSNTGGNYPPDYQNVIQSSIARLRILPMFLLRPVYRRAMLEDLYDFTDDVREFWRAFLTSLVARETKKELLSLYYCIQDAAMRTIATEDLQGWDGKVLIVESEKKEDLESQRQDVKELFPQAQVFTHRGETAMSVFVRTQAYEYMVKQFLLGK